MFCRECGIVLPDRAKFCPKCGTRVLAEKQVQPTDRSEQASIAPIALAQEKQDVQQAQETPSQKQTEPKIRYETKYVDRTVYIEKAPTTVMGWIGWLILTHVLPLIGAMIMAFSGDETNKTRQNYGKTLLIFQLILLFFIMVEWNEVSSLFRWLF